MKNFNYRDPNMQSNSASSSNGIWSGGRGYIDPNKWQQEYDSVDPGLRASMDYFRLNPGTQSYGWTRDSGLPIYDGADPQAMASLPSTITGLSGAQRRVNHLGQIIGDDGQAMRDGGGNMFTVRGDGVYANGQRAYNLQAGRVTALPTPGAGNRGGVGMPAPQEPGMPAPGTFGEAVQPGGQAAPMSGMVGAAVQPGGQAAPMSGMVGAAVQPGGQGAPMGGNPFAGLPPASGGSPMFEDGSPRMFGTPAQPGGQSAPMSGNPFAGLPPASGGSPMFEDDPFRVMYTGGTPNFDETTGQFRTPLPMGAGKFPFAGLPPASGGAPMFGDGSPRMAGHLGPRSGTTTPFPDQVRNPGTIPAIINEILQMQGIVGGQQPTSMTVPLNPGMTYTRPKYQPGTLPGIVEEYSNDFSWF